MTLATTSQGVQLRRGDGATPTEGFTLIAEIQNINGPNESTKQIDVTNLDSEAREYINGLIDGGEVSFDGNFVGSNAQQQGLRDDMVDGVLRNFELALADDDTNPTTISFSAIVTAFGIKSAVDTQVTFSATLKLSGLAEIEYVS